MRCYNWYDVYYLRIDGTEICERRLAHDEEILVYDKEEIKSIIKMLQTLCIDKYDNFTYYDVENLFED